jgi:hypothetical protein
MNNGINAVDYLLQFGYIGRSGAGDAGGLSAPEPSEELLSTAVQEFQEMALIPISGIVDETTQEAMGRPRCGFPDSGTVGSVELTAGAEFVAFGTSWRQAILTFSFENGTPDLDANVQRAIARTAFDRWAAVVPLVFREAGAGQQADIRIRYATGDHGDGAGLAFDGTNGTLAHAFFPPPNGGALAGDAHFDEDEAWQQGIAPGGYDLLTVFFHELGHSLGLDHTNVPSSTMNPFYPTPDTPAADDRAGMRRIYRDHIWIASLYRDLLGRRFDDAGLDGWVRQLSGGVSPENIARGFCYSKEFSEQSATQLYFTLLDRAPDPGGLAHWASRLSSGTSRQAVMTGFLESAEYRSNNPVPVRFVDSLYRRLLRRAPDAGGFSYWVNQMNSGATPGDVARGFLNSEEFARNLVREQYERFLRRSPEPGGWQYWTDRLKAGLAHQDLFTGFLASPEYRNASEGWW